MKESENVDYAKTILKSRPGVDRDSEGTQANFNKIIVSPFLPPPLKQGWPTIRNRSKMRNMKQKQP